MTNPFYNVSGAPAQKSSGSSAVMRAEYALIAAGFDKLPTLSGNALKVVRINSGASAMDVAPTTIDANGAISVYAGTVGTPGVNFLGDTNTGILNPGAGRIGFSINAAQAFEITSGQVFTNATETNVPSLAGTAGKINVAGLATIDTTTINVSRFSADANGPFFHLGKARGATIGAYTAVASGDVLGTMDFVGADGTDMAAASARIRALAAEAFTAGASGAKIEFATVATGGNTMTTRATIDADGKFFVGNVTTPATTRFGVTGVTPSVQSIGTAVANSSMLAFRGTADATGPIYFLAKSRAATVPGYDAVVNGDGLGSIEWGGADGTNIVDAARIAAQVDGTPGIDDMPTRLLFYTTSDGASSPVERLRIDSGGNTILTAQTTPPALLNNQHLVMNLTSNTNLRISARGTDGVTRVTNLTLA